MLMWLTKQHKGKVNNFWHAKIGFINLRQGHLILIAVLALTCEELNYDRVAWYKLLEAEHYLYTSNDIAEIKSNMQFSILICVLIV